MGRVALSQRWPIRLTEYAGAIAEAIIGHILDGIDA